MVNETIKNITNVFKVDAELLETSSKPRRAASIIKEFSLNTSTHGIPGIARSESRANRIFWSISLLIFTSIMTYFITQSIRAYFEYPSQTSVSVVTEWPQAFPAVTICNHSPLRYDTFIEPFLNYTNTYKSTNTTYMKNFTSEHASYVHDYLVYKLNRNESLLEYFYSLESMLMSCSYNRMACTAANFTWFMSPQFGLCYTFNAKLKDTFNRSLKYNADNGADGLLELRLYIHQHQYVPYLSNGIGVAVLVHDNEQIPLIEMTAMKLGPGRHHKLGYVKKISTFLPAPYTSCGTVITPGMEAMYSEYHDTDYGYFELPCYYACIQSYVYSKCNCGSPHRWAARFIVPPGVDKPIHIPLCNLSDSCYTEATSEIRNTQNIWTSYCATCDQECTYNDFIIRPTSLLAPPTYLLNDIKQFVESTTIPLPHNWSTSWVTDIQSSYVSLEVAYETTRTEVYSQQATISPVDVISNVGGHTGLWIGISFLSLMEIAEMIFRLCNSQCHRLRMNVKKKLRR